MPFPVIEMLGLTSQTQDMVPSQIYVLQIGAITSKRYGHIYHKCELKQS